MNWDQLQAFLASTGEQVFVFASTHLPQAIGVAWAIFMLWRYWAPQIRSFKSDPEDMKGVLKEEEKANQDPPEGVPFAEYRKDLLRMWDGTLSIDEFVDIWRGRKVQSRWAPVKVEEPAPFGVIGPTGMGHYAYGQTGLGPTGMGPYAYGQTGLGWTGIGATGPRPYSPPQKGNWWEGPTGWQGSSGVEGAAGPSGNLGVKEESLFKQINELRANGSEKAGAGGAIFDLINTVTKTLGDAHLKSVKELANQEAIRRVGTWVRVKKTGFGMGGMLGHVQDVIKAPKGMEDWITIKCCLVKGASSFMWGFDADKLEPALPRAEEWWSWTRERCPNPHGEDMCAFHSNTSDRERGFLFDALPEENRAEWFLEEVKQGCLEPVNYGFGK